MLFGKKKQDEKQRKQAAKQNTQKFDAKKHFSGKVSMTGERMDRLDANGNLPFGWLAYNQEHVQMIENDLKPFRERIINAKKVMDEYGAVKSYVLFLQDSVPYYKKNYGDDVAKYFVDHIIGSCEAETYFERMRYIEEHLDELLNEEREEERIQREVEGLMTIIFGEIVADEGMIQSEYLKTFPEDRKKLASAALYRLDHEGYIERIKHGRSYKLYVAEGRK